MRNKERIKDMHVCVLKVKGENKMENLGKEKHTSKHNRNINCTGAWEIWESEAIRNNHVYIINEQKSIQKR